MDEKLIYTLEIITSERLNAKDVFSFLEIINEDTESNTCTIKAVKVDGDLFPDPSEEGSIQYNEFPARITTKEFINTYDTNQTVNRYIVEMDLTEEEAQLIDDTLCGLEKALTLLKDYPVDLLSELLEGRHFRYLIAGYELKSKPEEGMREDMSDRVGTFLLNEEMQKHSFVFIEETSLLKNLRKVFTTPMYSLVNLLVDESEKINDEFYEKFPNLIKGKYVYYSENRPITDADKIKSFGEENIISRKTSEFLLSILNKTLDKNISLIDKLSKDEIIEIAAKRDIYLSKYNEKEIEYFRNNLKEETINEIKNRFILNYSKTNSLNFTNFENIFFDYVKMDFLNKSNCKKKFDWFFSEDFYKTAEEKVSNLKTNEEMEDEFKTNSITTMWKENLETIYIIKYYRTKKIIDHFKLRILSDIELINLLQNIKTFDPFKWFMSYYLYPALDRYDDLFTFIYKDFLNILTLDFEIKEDIYMKDNTCCKPCDSGLENPFGDNTDYRGTTGLIDSASIMREKRSLFFYNLVSLFYRVNLKELDHEIYFNTELFYKNEDKLAYLDLSVFFIDTHQDVFKRNYLRLPNIRLVNISNPNSVGFISPSNTLEYVDLTIFDSKIQGVYFETSDITIIYKD